jgi:uncharacterized cupredoxin-like copper-binding protein
MSRKRLWIGILVISLLGILGLAACGPKTAVLQIETQDFKYVPDQWSVPASSKVTMTLKNSGTQVHTWILMKKDTTATTPFGDADKPNILYMVSIEPNKTETFNFDAPSEPGEYEVVCGTPAHLEQGMKGTLTVTP